MTINLESEAILKKKILIVDDHHFIIEGYKNAIIRYNPTEFEFFITQAKNCESAYKIITDPDTAAFDIVFLDISMPPYEKKNIFSGEDLAKLVQHYMPNSKIVILTMYLELLMTESIIKTINPNALIMKNDLTFKELLFALDKVIKNETYYSESVRTKLKLLKNDN